jgi:uncharacterized protein (DUF1778 family)
MKKRVNVLLDEKERKEVAKAAKIDNRSRHQFMRVAILERVRTFLRRKK